MVQKYGEVSWSDNSADSGSSEKLGKDAFMRLEKGQNVVRLVTPPFAYQQHRYKAEGDPGFGTRLPCSKALHKACPVCDLGDKPKQRYYIGIIDRKSQSYKILDLGAQVFRAIKSLAQDDDWGDPIQYDIDIKVNPDGGPSAYYTVVPRPKKPMSAADLKLKEDANLDVLKLRSTPPEPDVVKSRLDKVLSGNSQGQPQSKSVKKQEVESDEVDADFQDYDAVGTSNPF